MRIRPSLNRSAALAGAAVLLAGLGLPVHAQDTPSQSNGVATAATGSEAGQRSARRARNRMICIRGDVTESRIPRQVCRTEAEWRATGEVPGEETGRR
jgi:hypothetical protein